MRKINVKKTKKGNEASDSRTLNQVKREMALPRIVSSLREQENSARPGLVDRTRSNHLPR
jgi:hypothetical protein